MRKGALHGAAAVSGAIPILPSILSHQVEGGFTSVGALQRSQGQAHGVSLVIVDLAAMR